jgi:hypothetical protein
LCYTFDMEVHKNILNRQFALAVEEACDRDKQLKRVYSKTHALFEDYAHSTGISVNKLLIIHICDQRGTIRPALERHVLEVYPLSCKSRSSYLSNVKRLIKAIIKHCADTPSEISKALLEKEIPEYILPALGFLARKTGFQNGRNYSAEKRLQAPYSEAGEYVLLAMLNIHERFEPKSLHALLVELNYDLIRELRKLSRPKFCSYRSYLHKLRKALGLPQPERETHSVPVERMLEPLRTELRTYQSLALNFGESKSPEDQLIEDLFVEAAADYEIELDNKKPSTIKETIRVFQNFYGRVLPLIQARGLTSISIKDFLLIQEEKREILGKEVTHSFNYFIADVRRKDRDKSTRYKRRGFDSQRFRLLVTTVKIIGVFNGFFPLIEDFRKAYSKINLDEWLIDQRREVKKRVYSIEYLDGEIERLKSKFERIVKEKSYIIKPGNRLEAHRNFNLCLFYVVFVLMRLLSYRQQCVRHCVFGRNIIFLKDGSIILQWSKDEVKNKKPIKITLKPEMSDGVWGPVIHALNLYKKTIYSHMVRRCREENRLDAIEGQFFLHLNFESHFIRFKKDDAPTFSDWFATYADHFLILPDEAIELDISVNPHHLRGTCMDWLFSLGMNEYEISLMTGTEPGTIRRRYFSKNALRDGTRVIAAADRRLKEERRADSEPASMIQQQEAKFKEVLASKEEENASLKFRVGDLEKSLAEATDSLISLQEARAEDRQVQQQQLEVSQQLLEELTASRAKAIQTDSSAKPRRDPNYHVDNCPEAYRFKLLHPTWYDTLGMGSHVASDNERANFYNDEEVNLISREVFQMIRGSRGDLVYIISPQMIQAAKLADRFKNEKMVRVHGTNGPSTKVADIVIVSFVTWDLPDDDDVCTYNFCSLYLALNTAWRQVYLFGDYEEASRRVRRLHQKYSEGVFGYYVSLFQPNSHFEQNRIPAYPFTPEGSKLKITLEAARNARALAALGFPPNYITLS